MSAVGGCADAGNKRLDETDRHPARRHRSLTQSGRHWRASLRTTHDALRATLTSSGGGGGGGSTPPMEAPVGRLWEHQQEGARFMAERLARPLVWPEHPGARVAGGLLCDDTRLGKTWTTLACWYADWASARGRAARAPSLVVCPKLGLEVWAEALRSYLGPALRARVRVLEVTPEAAPGAGRLHAADLRLDYDLILTTYTALTGMHQRGAHEALTAVDYRFVFCDEAHGAVNESTAVHATLAALHADAKWFITATPIQNAEADLRASLELIGVPPPAAASTEQCMALVRVLLLRRTKEAVAAAMGFSPEVLRFTTRDPLPRTSLDFATDTERALYAAMALGVEARFAAAAASGGTTAGARATDRCLLRPSAAVQAINDLRQLCVQPLRPLQLAGHPTSALPPVPPWLIVGSAAGDAFVPPTTDAAETLARTVAWRAARLDALVGAAARDAYAAAVRVDMEAAGQYTPAAWAALVARVEALVARALLPPVGTKARWLCRLLDERVDACREKVIVFSNWQEPLEQLYALLVERAELLGRAERGARLPVYIYGQTSRREREQSLARFAHDASVGYLLMTIKTGAVALDLSVANHVVLLDPWWNPHVEYQAIERIMGHRQQAANVHVHRLVLSHTIEAAVADLADEKLALSARFLEQGPAAASAADEEQDAARRLLGTLGR